MKVFPIGAIKFNHEPDAQVDQFPAVQANIDINAGFPPYEPQRLHRDGTLAVVGYGPSLTRTWEELRDYRTIWTVSGAHDFLLARGIVPTYHTDVDWRPHKAGILDQPSAAVQYRMANTVHPDYINKLRTYNLSMFQPSGNQTEKYLKVGAYPQIPMPGDVTMLAIQAAVMEGWKDIHTFGVDGSHDFSGRIHAPDHRSDNAHAGRHEGVRSPIVYVIDDGYELYETSLHLIQACDAFVKMIDDLPDDVGVTVVSDGLLPAWMSMHEQRRKTDGS